MTSNSGPVTTFRRFIDCSYQCVCSATALLKTEGVCFKQAEQTVIISNNFSVKIFKM